MQISTWNCARKQRERILPAARALNSDFVLLQELPCPNGSSPDELWIGTNPNQGVSVISCTGAPISLAGDYDKTLRYALPVEVGGDRPFQLLAIWMLKDPEHYVPNLVALLEHYRPFISRGPTVVAGDFNANPGFDKKHPRYLFESITATLEELGLCSAYHANSGEAHGHETKPTYFHQYNRHQPFHIDYLFFPKSWRTALSQVTVGNFEDYASLSDQLPLSATFAHDNFTTA